MWHEAPSANPRLHNLSAIVPKVVYCEADTYTAEREDPPLLNGLWQALYLECAFITTTAGSLLVKLAQLKQEPKTPQDLRSEAKPVLVMHLVCPKTPVMN